MPGFSNITSQDSIMFADNASFDGTERNGVINQDGQLWIGHASLNPGGTHINAGHLVSIDSSLTIGYSSPNITLSVTGGSTVGKTITGDSGGALSPTLGNWNILGRSGSKTSGSGSTLTIKSPPYSDSTAVTLTINSGTFATAAGTYTLPASPLDGDLCEIVCITTGIVVTGNTGQKIQFGSTVSSTAGTATNSSKGDVVCLRYRATDTSWYATSIVGVWVLA